MSEQTQCLQNLPAVDNQRLRQLSVRNLNAVIRNARQAFLPPPPETVSEWADHNRLLTREESPTAGLWNTENTPYLRDIMNVFTDKTTQVTTVLKATQLGFTEAAINVCGYTIDRSPCRIFYVMPDEDLAKDFSVDRLQKALKNTPNIARKIESADRSKALVIRFPGGMIRLSGANSPAKLASWPIPWVIMDEVDKFPQWSGREASPVSLIKERTKNWPWRKILVGSTPTTEWGFVYRSYMESEAHYQFYVPCPECGHYQTFQFKNLKFPTVVDDRRLIRETYYECENCHHHIRDKEKLLMLRKGKWQPDEELGYKPKLVGFKINTLYSPWVAFADVAKEFLRSKDDPAALMNFVNSWLAEPWKSKSAEVKAKAVLDKKTKIPSGIVPSETLILTGGVDRQQGYFYWVIRAWMPKMGSMKIANGSAETWDDVKRIMDQFWPVENSDRKMQVILYAVDSGYETEDTYDFCYYAYGDAQVAVPVKGASQALVGYYKRTKLQPNIEKGRNWQRTMDLFEIDTNKVKDFIFYRMNKELGEEGCWMVDADTDEVYANMITAEHKVRDGDKEVWRLIGKKDNHYLDCEVYNTVAAMIMNVQNMQTESPEEMPQQTTMDDIIPDYFNPEG